MDGIWVYQGRQAHGWFGNGTAPQVGGSTPDGLFSSSETGQRVDHAAHSIILPVLRGDRGRWAGAADSTVRSRLKTLVVAWAGASGLGREAFRARFFDPYTSDDVIDGVRRAAKGLVEAGDHEALAKAGQDLAAVAIGGWSG